MATITNSYRETSDDDGGVSYGLRGYSTWTFSLTGSNMTVSTSSFVPATTMTAKYVCPSNYSVIANMGKVESAFFLKIGSTQLMEVHHDKSRTDGYMRGEVDMRNNTVYTTSVTERYPASISTSSVFNSSNSTSITATIGAYNSFLSFSSSYNGSDLCSGYQYSGTGSSWGNLFTVTLDAPPTFNSTQVSFINDYDGDAYVGLTTAKVTLSSLSAKYGGTISSATLTIGNQTATRTSNGVLSILLDSAGMFTPTVTVTDSRGQVTTKTLNPIVVKSYVAPSMGFSVERTDSSGVENDEGECAVVEANIDWTDAVATLTAPTVVVRDPNGIPVSAIISWYKDGALTTAISDWSTITSSDMPIYCLIDNANHDALNTQYSYQITLTPNDSLGSGLPITQTIGSAFYTIDFLAGGHGIAFGKPASQEIFECNMDAQFNKDLVAQDMTSTEVDDFVDALDAQGESLDDFLDARLNTLGGKNTGTISLYNCSGTVSHNNLEFFVSEGGEIWVQGRININSYVRSGANSGVIITLPDIVPTPTKEFWSLIGFQSQHPREYVYISLTPNSRAAYIQTSESFNNTTNGTLTFICSGRVFVK